MNPKQFGILVCSMVAAAFGQVNLYSQDCRIDVAVMPTKAFYASDELVSVSVSLKNSGVGEERIRLKYPTLQYAAGVFMTFTPTGTLIRSPDLPWDPGGLNAPMKLPAGRGITTRVYLQRFLAGFRSGRHAIPWEATVPCEDRTRPVNVRGVLQFEILAVPSFNLESNFAESFRRIEQRGQELLRQMEGGPSYFTETPFLSEEAVEALQLTASPLVIPFLERLIRQNDQVLQTRAFDGLSKFPTNTDARRIVFQTLQSEKPADLAQSLRVLTKWREKLPESDLRQLMGKGIPGLRIEVLRYIGRTEDAAYVSPVQEHLKDSNSEVSRAAQVAAFQIARGASR